jgi:hypothetical protein
MNLPCEECEKREKEAGGKGSFYIACDACVIRANIKRIEDFHPETGYFITSDWNPSGGEKLFFSLVKGVLIFLLGWLIFTELGAIGIASSWIKFPLGAITAFFIFKSLSTFISKKFEEVKEQEIAEGKISAALRAASQKKEYEKFMVRSLCQKYDWELVYKIKGEMKSEHSQ